MEEEVKGDFEKLISGTSQTYLHCLSDMERNPLTGIDYLHPKSSLFLRRDDDNTCILDSALSALLRMAEEKDLKVAFSLLIANEDSTHYVRGKGTKNNAFKEHLERTSPAAIDVIIV